MQDLRNHMRHALWEIVMMLIYIYGSSTNLTPVAKTWCYMSHAECCRRLIDTWCEIWWLANGWPMDVATFANLDEFRHALTSMYSDICSCGCSDIRSLSQKIKLIFWALGQMFKLCFRTCLENLGACAKKAKMITLTWCLEDLVSSPGSFIRKFWVNITNPCFELWGPSRSPCTWCPWNSILGSYILLRMREFCFLK